MVIFRFIPLWVIWQWEVRLVDERDPDHAESFRGWVLADTRLEARGEARALWDDGTIRVAEECTQDGNIGDDCRCLQYRPYLGVNAFDSFVAKDVQPDGGVQVIKFTPVSTVDDARS